MERTVTETALPTNNNTPAEQIAVITVQLEKFKMGDDPAATVMVSVLEAQLKMLEDQQAASVDAKKTGEEEVSADQTTEDHASEKITQDDDVSNEQEEASVRQPVEDIVTATTPQECNATGSAVVVIDQARKQAIEALFNASINNPRFWTNSKRLDRLEDALKVPLFDNKSLQGFATGAREELIKKAMGAAIKNKTVPVMPTEAEIAALAEEKYQDKLNKDAEKAAKAANKK